MEVRGEALSRLVAVPGAIYRNTMACDKTSECVSFVEATGNLTSRWSRKRRTRVTRFTGAPKCTGWRFATRSPRWRSGGFRSFASDADGSGGLWMASSRSSPAHLPHSCHTGRCREARTARECRIDAGFLISRLSQAGGSIPPPTANTSRALRGGPGAAAAREGPAPAAHRRATRPDAASIARLVPRCALAPAARGSSLRLLRETPRTANGSGRGRARSCREGLTLHLRLVAP